MSHSSDMPVHESLSLLNELGVVEWLSNDVAASTRLIVNAVAAALLDTENPADFMPRDLEWPKAVTDTLPNQIECDDWFDLLSGGVMETVVLNADAIGYSISDHDSMLTHARASHLALRFARAWTNLASDAFSKAMASAQPLGRG